MNFLKVVPLWKLSGAMSRPEGLVVIHEEVLTGLHDRDETNTMGVTRSIREWENGFVESTENMFKELMWELALEGK